MTHHDFNQKLLLAKDTALDTLKDLCAPAFPKRRPTPQANPEGTPLTWDQKQAFRRSQPPHLSPDEQHLAIAERTQRMRAASTILKTRPIGQDGNPLPISKAHPQHHTRTTPRQQRPDDTDEPSANLQRDSTNPERERAGDDPTSTHDADHALSPTTDDAPPPEDAPSHPAPSAAGTPTSNAAPSGGPTNTAPTHDASSAVLPADIVLAPEANHIARQIAPTAGHRSFPILHPTQQAPHLPEKCRPI